jgi:hypothetical protein
MLKMSKVAMVKAIDFTLSSYGIATYSLLKFTGYVGYTLKIIPDNSYLVNFFPYLKN